MFPQTQLENQASTRPVKVSTSFISTAELQLSISLTERQADGEGEGVRTVAGMWGAVVL